MRPIAGLPKLPSQSGGVPAVHGPGERQRVRTHSRGYGEISNRAGCIRRKRIVRATSCYITVKLTGGAGWIVAAHICMDAQSGAR